MVARYSNSIQTAIEVVFEETIEQTALETVVETISRRSIVDDSNELPAIHTLCYVIVVTQT
jgi:hypothetical protein